ncbi:DUF4166 domain-containing protein [Massilia sp. Leaf139]|uniref:DUF4166 domain-containing protein n=1 Tax=Massilia sp. Leaf139 TaxID=1736272 RepID=UPI0006F3A885|nr:DUF4166 domain-containing protein [Massilia sp. Leaf139]KQQ87416.1 hypothetical protein ASF77_17800 [Massilia sp. Leaf139]
MNDRAMYETVMGSAFGQLAEPVQAFHRSRGRRVLHGQVRTEAPQSTPARLLARCLGTPLLPSSGAIRFELDARPDRETWVRHFPTNTMRSHMTLVGGELTERLGLTRLRFGLNAEEGRLVMELRGLQFLGIPCPRWALPRIVAEEEGRDGRLYFKVSAALPLVGQVAGYSGHLVIHTAAPEQP